MFRAITLATLTVGLAASASAQAVHVSAVGVRPTDCSVVLPVRPKGSFGHSKKTFLSYLFKPCLKRNYQSRSC